MLKASKFIHFPLLIEPSEMHAMLDALPPFSIYNIAEVKEEVSITQADFLSDYEAYVEALKRGGRIPFVSGAFTMTEDAIEIKTVPDGRKLARPLLPIVQFRPYHFTKGEGKIQPLTWGADTIAWGLQFSFPQIYAKKGNVEKSKESPNFPLFRALQQWVRHNTKPTPIAFGEKEIMTPIRTSPSALSWRQHVH